MGKRGVAELVAVRHGQSLTNVAFPAADAAGLEESGVSGPDAEVPLSEAGRAQSLALGRWLVGRGASAPDVVLSSVYARARQTADLALGVLREHTGHAPAVRPDERLRDRETGILEMRTRPAIQRLFPEEVARRDLVGEFFYRPPAGESMADVALRTRDVLRDLTEEYAGARVLLVCHDAVVLILRYLLEDIPTERVWGLGPVVNCAVTRWTPEDGRLTLAEFNAAAHLTTPR